MEQIWPKLTTCKANLLNKNQGLASNQHTLCQRVKLLTMKFSLLLVVGVLGLFQGAASQSVWEDLVPMGEKWKKFCLDNEGNKYKKNQKMTGTCEEFTCSFKKKKYSWKAKVRKLKTFIHNKY